MSFVWNKQMLGSVKRKRISLMAVVARTSSSADQLSTLPSTNKLLMRSGLMQDPKYTFPLVVTLSPLSLKLALADSRYVAFFDY